MGKVIPLDEAEAHPERYSLYAGATIGSTATAYMLQGVMALRTILEKAAQHGNTADELGMETDDDFKIIVDLTLWWEETQLSLIELLLRHEMVPEGGEVEHILSCVGREKPEDFTRRYPDRVAVMTQRSREAMSLLSDMQDRVRRMVPTPVGEEVNV